MRKPPSVTCRETLGNGRRCQRSPHRGSEYCRWHQPKPEPDNGPPTSDPLYYSDLDQMTCAPGIRPYELFTSDQLKRWLQPDAIVAVEAHPRLGVYLSIRSTWKNARITMGLQKDLGGPAGPADMQDMGLADLTATEPVFGTRPVYTSVLEEQFNEPGSILLHALMLGQKVYARGDRLKKHLAEILALPDFTITWPDGEERPITDLAGRIQSGEPPFRPPLDPQNPYYDLLPLQPGEEEGAISETPDGEAGEPSFGEQEDSSLSPAEGESGSGGAEFHVTHPPALMAGYNENPAIAFHRSMSRPEAWVTNHVERTKEYQDASTGYGITYQPETFARQFEEEPFNEDQLARVLEEVERTFLRVPHDLSADVFDIMVFHWHEQQKVKRGHAHITISEIITVYRQRKLTQDAIDLHWQALRGLRSMRFSGSGMDGAIINADSIRLPGELPLYPGDCPPRSDAGIIYAPGPILAKVMEESKYISFFSPGLLRLDPVRYRDAKRLGRALRTDWRLNPEKYTGLAEPRYRKWGALLADAGVTWGERDKKHASEFIAARERDLCELADAGAIAKPPCGRILDWVTHPEDQGKLPHHGKLSAFLGRRVFIPPPPGPIHDELYRIAQKRLAQQQQQAQRKALIETRKALAEARRQKV